MVDTDYTYVNEGGKSYRKCNHCGHIEIKYEEHLSKIALIALVKLRDCGGESRSRDLDLSEYSAIKQQSIRSNLQKLQYFDLVRKADSRMWKITDFGLDFLDGKVECSSKVIRYKDNIIEKLDPIYFSDIGDLTYVDQKEYYEEQARINIMEEDDING